MQAISTKCIERVGVATIEELDTNFFGIEGSSCSECKQIAQDPW